MEDIIVSLEPVFHRLERFILWHNRYASLLAFVFFHGIFYAIAHAGLRPYSAITIVLLIFHVLDCIRRKRSYDDEKNLSELTKLILRSYRYAYQTQEQLSSMKTQNRIKHSLLVIIVCVLSAYLGVKVDGYHLSYFIILLTFTLPAIIYHKIIRKVLRLIAPILEQLDESMQYQRRTLIDRKDLLVKVKTPGVNEGDDDDDEDIRNLKQTKAAQNIAPIEIEDKHEMLEATETNLELTKDMSSDDANRLNEFFVRNSYKTNVGQRMNTKEPSNVQLFENFDTKPFRSNKSDVIQISASEHTDPPGFEFLNDCDDRF